MAPLIAVVVVAGFFPAPASAGTRGHCGIRGPRWDLYGIHDGAHRTGTRYRIFAT